MGNGVITFSTITYAMKAQSLLQRNGIKADIIKTQDNLLRTCQYRLNVHYAFDKAVGLLAGANITYLIAINGE
ncbi:DUF3343 domain-containing protein [Acetanaerobacterium elongatum]|uniref:Putative Se/S carrier protein-like domain-containing protein n=1 Tax=Acetanaerobacterium elongatum TaxID=258515 RepID=A0A1H0A534_9FIRM|nr:DUF3343 domain-containing protein [Acetanaerobacterium elongatum]SDN28912.1 Protein of unknown function [Acetanaerobacterium elongatum]